MLYSEDSQDNNFGIELRICTFGKGINMEDIKLDYLTK
jgi:hypothetical protein